MAASATSGSQTETKDAHKFWGYLIKPDKTAADKLDRLLRGIADCIVGSETAARAYGKLTFSSLTAFNLDEDL